MTRPTTRLVAPDVTRCDSWAAMLADFGDDYPHGSGAEPGSSYGPDDCVAFVAERLAFATEETLPRADWVTCSYYWIADGDDLVGFLALRHRLNDWLLEEGGHIGYSVRPSRRREGHAGRALSLALVEAGGLGLDRVLVTCEEDNLASRRTIEGAGGALEDVRVGKRRYWIETSSGR